MPMDPLDRMSNENRSANIDPLQDWIDRVRRLPDVRHEKIESIRNAIRDDAYEEKEVIEATVSRLFDEVELA